jgi:hypothetical protein
MSQNHENERLQQQKITYTVQVLQYDYKHTTVLRPAQKIFTYIMRRHHCRRRAAKFGLRAFEQGVLSIVSHLLWNGTSVFPVSSEGLPHLIASYDTQGEAEDLF